MVTLREALESLLLERDISHTHAQALRYRLDLYGQWLGRLATIEDLEPDRLNAWIVHLQGRYAPRTVRHYRDGVLFVWRGLWERGEVITPPVRIRRVKVPQSPVRAWTIEEIRRLVEAIPILRGCVPQTQIPRRDWYRAYILTAYATGLRRCDLMHYARWSDVSGDVLALTQHKTGFVVYRRLTGQALAALRLVGSEGYLLPWPGRVQSFWESFARLVRSAEIRPGCQKWLRRSAGSMVERQAPGSGGQFLGHRTPGMFDAHYHDRSISSRVPEPPPEI